MNWDYLIDLRRKIRDGRRIIPGGTADTAVATIPFLVAEALLNLADASWNIRSGHDTEHNQWATAKSTLTEVMAAQEALKGAIRDSGLEPLAIGDIEACLVRRALAWTDLLFGHAQEAADLALGELRLYVETHAARLKEEADYE